MKGLNLGMMVVCLLSALVFAHAGEKPISAIGTIGLEIFPGRPNYESIQDGDAPEGAWILTTRDKKRFQLVVLNNADEKFATLRRSIGKKVRVEGTVWEAISGHHHTPFLITVVSIKEEHHYLINRGTQDGWDSRPYLGRAVFVGAVRVRRVGTFGDGRGRIASKLAPTG
jgi:hypothetical protein